ncbi:MAG TPA: Nramp family divalent metal transporter [Gemmatimonadaceae bacterium]|jgi:NRAMP (natural resistance-associated macrophage protein)-like metal ion transporter
MEEQRERHERHPSTTIQSGEASDTGAAAFLRKLGPGLITGAADDDPSGIATYSQAGAAFGYGLLWTALVSLPLMIAVQLMCARVGVVAKSGLASALREHYSRRLLWFACILLIVANTLNIAADLGGMAASAQLLTGIPRVILVPLFAALILGLLIFASYESMARVFKWFSLALFAYVIAGILAHPSLLGILKGTLIPAVRWDKTYLLTFVAILGTTISPYLFFWQAAQVAEQEEHIRARFPLRRRRGEMRRTGRELKDAALDTESGMFVSQLIMFFIVLTAGATLHRAGITDVQTADQAASALRPLAGPLAYWLFALGIIGTGMLGVPVLAGSAAYAIAEAGAFKGGMDEKPDGARVFYGVMAIAMVTGTLLALTKLNAMKMLLWSAVMNGVLAPPLIVIILLVCNNEKIMGKYKNGRLLNVLGWCAAILMGTAAIAMIVSLFM